MSREINLYGEERPLPYWVRLACVDEAQVYGAARDTMQTLLHLDLRGGEFTRASSARLARVFDWLTKAYRVRLDNVADHCLIITPMDPDLDFQLVDAATGRRPENWPMRRGEAFRWVPIPYDDEEQRYAWQR